MIFFKRNKTEERIDEFYDIIFKLSYKRYQKKELIEKAKKLALQIPELKGWPDNNKKFWDIESYTWFRRIPKRIRLFIKKELEKITNPKDLNLSLGSGSYPYLENSVLLDFSEQMLDSADKKYKKVKYDLEKGTIPFKNNSFDTITMVFIINYLKNLKQILKQAKKIVKNKLIIINSKKLIIKWYRQKEVKHYGSDEIRNLLESIGFKTKIKEITKDKITLLLIEAHKS